MNMHALILSLQAIGAVSHDQCIGVLLQGIRVRKNSTG